MSRRGQAVVEYLVVAVALIAVVLGFTDAIRQRSRDLMQQARNEVTRAATDPAATADAILPSIP